MWEGELGLEIPEDEFDKPLNVKFMRDKKAENEGESHFFGGQVPYCVSVTSELSLKELSLYHDPYRERGGAPPTDLEPIVEARIWWLGREEVRDKETASAPVWDERCEQAAGETPDYIFTLGDPFTSRCDVSYSGEGGVSFRPLLKGLGQFTFYFGEEFFETEDLPDDETDETDVDE